MVHFGEFHVLSFFSSKKKLMWLLDKWYFVTKISFFLVKCFSMLFTCYFSLLVLMEVLNWKYLSAMSFSCIEDTWSTFIDTWISLNKTLRWNSLLITEQKQSCWFWKKASAFCYISFCWFTRFVGSFLMLPRKFQWEITHNRKTTKRLEWIQNERIEVKKNKRETQCKQPHFPVFSFRENQIFVLEWEHQLDSNIDSTSLSKSIFNQLISFPTPIPSFIIRILPGDAILNETS